MYYLSSTWIISNELKLTSWKPFWTFYCFSSNEKFLPRAPLIKTCFLAQQGWLCTRTWELLSCISSCSPEQRCLYEQTQALAFHDFQRTGSSFDPSSSTLCRLAACPVPLLPILIPIRIPIFLFPLSQDMCVVQRAQLSSCHRWGCAGGAQHRLVYLCCSLNHLKQFNYIYWQIRSLHSFLPSCPYSHPYQFTPHHLRGLHISLPFFSVGWTPHRLRSLFLPDKIQ